MSDDSGTSWRWVSAKMGEPGISGGPTPLRPLEPTARQGTEAGHGEADGDQEKEGEPGVSGGAIGVRHHRTLPVRTLIIR